MEMLDCIILFYCYLGLLLYFLPTILVFSDNHVNRKSIMLLNLLLGWTLLGWIVSFILAIGAEKYCSKCENIISGKAKVCPNCGAKQVKMKSAGLAAVLSALIVGLGQIYNGQVGKGILLFCLAIVNAMLTFVIIGFIIGWILRIYGIYDAYSTANKINKSEITI